jgi:CHAD domain-containing protein
MTTNRTAIRRRLAIRGRSHRPPWGAGKAGHDSILAPFGATVAATLAVGVGLVIARSERQRRRARQRRLERRLGLARDEPLAAGLRRMALAQADLAIEQLSTGDGGVGAVAGASAGAQPPDETAVHETRKALKRLRALLRLLEHELGAKTYARETAVLRDVAQQLSVARDAAVMLNTLDALIERHPRKLARRRGVRKLRQQLHAEHARLQQRTLAEPAEHARVLGELHGFRWRVAAWQLGNRPGLQLVERDLKRIYGQGRRRHQRVASGRGKRVIAMHEWRKRVKDLRYAAEMLGPSGPGKPGGRGKSAQRLRAIAGRADDLGELLGEDHDLAIFAQHLRAGGHGHAKRTWHTDRGTRRALLKLIAKRRRKLRERALRQGARLYRERPKRFTRQIRSLS